MIRKITLISFLLFFIFNSQLVLGQYNWWSQSGEELGKTENGLNQKLFGLNKYRFEEQIKKIPFRYSNTKAAELNLPGIDGKSNKFSVYRTNVLHPKLQEKYPELMSFVGVNLKTPTEMIRFVYHPAVGIKGIITGDDVAFIIDPVKMDRFKIFELNDQEIEKFNCETESIRKSYNTKNFNQKNANDGNLRRYRLALAVSGEYAQFFLDGSEQNDQERKGKVLAAMVSSINRVNGIFERDFSITMQIIPENEELIYLNPSTDPFSTGSSLNGQLQNAIDTNANIGNSRYDVGHLFHVENSVYGNAGCIACVCTTGSKGSAFTVHTDPSSDNFNMIVAHEFGHQFGGYHVQSSSNCRSGFNSEVEPGSGSTIMGYAGICPANVQNGPDDYFNYVDIRDVAIWTIDNSSCAEIIDITNSAPTVEAGPDHIIPRSTPFVLEAEASDTNAADLLTYCWEQNNPENPNSSSSPRSDWVNGPLFRSKYPSRSNKRYFPSLEDIISGNLAPTWEVLPSVARTMRFEVTVRDNVIEGGQSNTDGLTITVDDSSGPFVITSQSSSEIWNVGDQVTIQWDVANTNVQPVNTMNVDIYMSVDGGNTFPYLLQDDITNDGSETFVLPNVESTSQARIMVKGSGNVFFAVNSADITVQASEFTITSNTVSASICQSEDAVFNFDYKTFLDFNERTSFSVENLPEGVMASFTPSDISGEQVAGIPIGLTVSNTSLVPIGSYPFTIVGTSASGIAKILEANLDVYESGITPVSLLSPENNVSAINVETVFEWEGDDNTEGYQLQIATDVQFLSIIESISISETTYSSQALSYDNTYFWRVISNNPCEENIISSVNTFHTQCANPDNLRYNGLGATYVNLTWDDQISTNWDIQYGTSGFILGNGTIVNTSNNTIEINGLSSLMPYDFYLRSKCSAENSGSWIGPLSVNTTANYCAGDRFYDSGGPNGNYQNGELETTVISPESNDDRVRVKFDAFQTESCCDYLRVYDGPDTSAPLIGTYRGSNSPGVLISSHDTGSLTFVFYSDGSVVASGWDAEVVCEPKPNCAQPNDFILDVVNAREATLVWQTDGNTSSWDLEYGLSGFQEGTGTTVNATQTTFVLQGLEPTTSYDVYIRGNCTEGGVSDIVGPISFQTLCDVVNAPFSESFQQYNLPQCWNQSGSENWIFNRNANHNASNAGDRNPLGNSNYAWIDGSSPNGDNQISVLTTPLINITNLVVPSIQFSAFSRNTIDNTYNTLRAEFYDGITWNTIIELQENTNGWRDIAFNLSSYTINGPIQVRFTVIENSPGNSEYNDILIDEIKIDELPTCLNPYNPLVSNIRSRSAGISWTASGFESNWELLYGRRGFSAANGINEVVNDSTYEITSLDPQTEYELYIRAICDIGDNSEYIGPIYFTTPCDPFSTPFEETFVNYNNPVCWTMEGNRNWSFGRYYDPQLGRQVEDRTTGGQTNYAWINVNAFDPLSNSYLITPFVDVSQLTTPSLQFSINSNTVSSNEYSTLSIEVFDGADWILVQNIEGSSNGWRDYYYDLSSYNISDDVRVRFRVTPNLNSTEFNYILIDDVRVRELPSCFNPYSLQVSSTSFDAVTVNWSDDINLNWQIEYGLDGFISGSGTIMDVMSKEIVISNLLSGSNYQFYVRANCGSGDFSEWIGPVDIKTLSDFCGGDRFYDSGGPNGNYQNGELETTVISPESNDDRVRVKFDAFQTESCCDYLRVYDGPDTSAPLIGTYRGSNSPGVLISSHDTGSLTFVFYSDGSVVASGWDAEVICEPKPNCNTPANLVLVDVLAYSASLAWDASTESDSWQIEYGQNGFTPGNGTVVNSNTSSILLTDLSQNTFYDVYLKASCVAGGFSDPVKISFTTEIGCPDPSGVNLVDAQPSSLLLNWNINSGNEQTWDVEYGESGFGQGSGFLLQADTNDIVLENLIANTDYDIYLRANCLVNDQSAWVGPYKFRTSCNPTSGDSNELIVNGSFECGDLAGWSSTGPGEGLSSCRVNFTVLESSVNVCLAVPEIDPSDGRFAAFTSFDGLAGDTYVLEQTISLPNDIASAISVTLSYDFKVAYDLTAAAATEGRRLTAAFYDQNDNLLFNVNQIIFGIEEPLSGNISINIEEEILNQLLTYAGQSVILRFSAYVPDEYSGPSKALIDNVSLEMGEPLAVEDQIKEDNQVVLSPNPSNGTFNISYSGSDTLRQIQVFNLMGKLIYREDIQEVNSKQKVQLPNVEAGIYLVRIVSDTATIFKKIVIDK